MMFPQTLTGIQLNFAGSERARAIGAYSIALAAGAVTGQVLGGVLVTADVAGLAWRPIFLVNVPICVLTLIAAAVLLPGDEKREVRQVDPGGVCILSAALLLAVAPLILGRGQGWPAWTWGALAASAPTSWAFVAHCRRRASVGRASLVNIAALSPPAVLLGLAALMVATGTYYALLFSLAQYFQTGLGRSALASGLILVPWVAAFGLAGQLTRRLPDRIGRVLPFAAYILLAVAYLGLAVVTFVGIATDGILALLLAVGGLGLGAGFFTLIGHLTAAVSADYAADLSGVTTSTLQIGGVVGVAALGTAYFSLAGHGGYTHASHAFGVVSLTMGVAALGAAGAAWLATRFRDGHPGVP